MVVLLRLLEVTPSLNSVTRKFNVVSSIGVANYSSLNYLLTPLIYIALFILLLSPLWYCFILLVFGSLLFMQKVIIY